MWHPVYLPTNQIMCHYLSFTTRIHQTIKQLLLVAATSKLLIEIQKYNIMDAYNYRGTGMIASSSTFCPHPGRVIRDLFRLLDAVYGIVRKH